jgi:hypothetical protein
LSRHLVHSWSTTDGTARHNLTPAPVDRTGHQVSRVYPLATTHKVATKASDGTFATATPTAGS